MSTVRLTSSDRRDIWTCTQSSYGPEPNLDMYAVSATIQLMFRQEYGRANLLLLSTQIKSDVCSLQSQHQNPFYVSSMCLPWLCIQGLLFLTQLVTNCSQSSTTVLCISVTNHSVGFIAHQRQSVAFQVTGFFRILKAPAV